MQQNNIIHLLVAAALIGTSFAATCSAPAVTLPGSNVPGPCPGTPAATVDSAPYQYTLPAGYRFDYAYVKANDGNCKLVVLQGPQKCYQVTARQSTYKVTFTGSKNCAKIKKVHFYTSACNTSPYPVIPCGTQRKGVNITDTVAVEMGQSNGTFFFEYNSYDLADAFNVTYENTLLFQSDSTGYSSTMISFSGTSTQIIVSVQPNSDDASTWVYEAHCVGDNTPSIDQNNTIGECYDANMMVNIMVHGKISQKRVGDVRRGDLVQTFHSDGTTHFERAIYSYDHDGIPGKVIRMNYENVQTGEKGYVAVTKNHVMLTSEDQEFTNGNAISARYIKKGSYLFGLNNAVLKIVEIESYDTEIVSIQTHSLSLVVNGVYSYTYNYGSLFGFLETIGQRIGDYLIPEDYDLTFLKTISPGFVVYGLPVVEKLYSIFH